MHSVVCGAIMCDDGVAVDVAEMILRVAGRLADWLGHTVWVVLRRGDNVG